MWMGANPGALPLCFFFFSGVRGRMGKGRESPGEEEGGNGGGKESVGMGGRKDVRWWGVDADWWACTSNFFFSHFLFFRIFSFSEGEEE